MEVRNLRQYIDSDMDYSNTKFGSDIGYLYHSYMVKVKLFVVKGLLIYSNLWMNLEEVEK